MVLTCIFNNKGKSGGEEDKSMETRVELLLFNLAVIDAIKTAYKDPFELLFEGGVHQKEIL